MTCVFSEMRHMPRGFIRSCLNPAARSLAGIGTRYQRQLATSSPRHEAQFRIRATYYRGGTSRGLMLLRDDLPEHPSDWGPILAGILGSPDPNGRRLDGMGTGIGSLSKICVIGRPTRRDVDVDYTFVQVGVEDGTCDFSSNCGNMSSAVGPFARDSGLIAGPADNGRAVVKIFNTNTGKIIRSTFSVSDGETEVSGPLAIDGVAGTGAKIELAFLDPWGSRTGKLLPTGQVVDDLDGIKVSCVDVGNPCVFVDAKDLLVDGTILPSKAESHPTLFNRLESLRRSAGVAMGIASEKSLVPEAVPKIVMVSSPALYTTLSGRVLGPSTTDLTVRSLSGTGFHRALQITAALATAGAARIPGTVVADRVSPIKVDRDGITLGHPSGTLLVKATIDANDMITEATVFRTARRLMEGWVYWKAG